MSLDKISIQYNKALELKKDAKYATALKAELSKPEWKQQLNAIDERLAVVGSKTDFDKCFKQLVDLFDQIYEKITAPGLDAFIGWIEEHTKNNDENIKKLRAFLKKDYESYSSSIDGILSSIAELPQEDEKHLFDTMISDFNKKLKKDVSNFVNAPDKFVNNIADFLSNLTNEYSVMCSIPELKYSSADELYTSEQKEKNSIDFYKDIISKAITSSQNLKELDDQEKNISLSNRAKKRISSIKKCIDILLKSGVADSDDEDLKYLFLRFEKEMLDTNGEVSAFLSSYMANTWEPLEIKYNNIKEFYDTPMMSFKESDWKDFEKGADITALVSDYNSVRSGSVLPQLRAFKQEELNNKITSCDKKISELKKKEDNTSSTIVDFFKEILITYNNKKPLLLKLVEKHPELQSKYDSIYAQGKCTTTIENGINTIQTGSFLKALEEGTIFDMITDMNSIKNTFLEILKQSQLEEQINWLNSLESTEIDNEHFKPEFIRELVSNGLITLSFKKEF